jgi:hypothetical protein
MYHAHVHNGTRPSLEEFAKLLNSEAQWFSKVFVVIDALDECTENNNTRDVLLREMKKRLPRLQLLVTLRPHVTNIPTNFETRTLEIYAKDEDIRIYLESKITTLRRLKLYIETHPALRDEVINAIAKKVRGMLIPFNTIFITFR